MNIGFVGLGAMGAGIVPRLMAAGHAVTGWNRSKQQQAEGRAVGGRGHAAGADASRMPAATNGSAFCLLLLAAVPARHRVARGHEPWDDAGAHGAQPNETDVHASTSQRAALSPLAPSPQPKSDISASPQFLETSQDAR